ncbi:ctse-b [Symbiodinium sp. CCMP2456]|nr:ctse-b [Symbiodinium sp. CCMP2456]
MRATSSPTHPWHIRCLVATLAFLQPLGGTSAQPGEVVVSLTRQRRLLPDSWGRRQSTVEYFAEVEVGSPSQSFRMIFDTGSANVVIPSSHCLAPSCLQSSRYDAGQSSTAERELCLKDIEASNYTREAVTLTFGTGQVTGHYAKDQVCVGQGLCTALSFVEATNQSEHPFLNAPYDGVLGLALPQLSQDHGFCLFDELVKSRKLTRPLFAVYFSLEGGEISFGKVDVKRMESELKWAPVWKPGFWQVSLTDLTLNGSKTDLCGAPGSYTACAAALDTGTSALTAPTRLARQLAELLQVAPDCSNFDALPTLGFLLEEVDLELELTPQDYVEREEDTCELQLMAVDVPRPDGPLFLLGDPFLRRYYTVYDRQRLRIGFALARQSINEKSDRKGKLTSPQVLLALEHPPTMAQKQSQHVSGATGTSQISGGSYNDYRQNHRERLERDIELTTGKLELEQRRLAKLDKDLDAATSEQSQKLYKYKVDPSFKDDPPAQKKRKALQLERKVDLAISRYNRLNETNDGLRAQIDQLRKERQLLDQVFRKMQDSIRINRKDIELANQDIVANRSDLDKKLQNCQASSKALEKKRRSFLQQTEELKRQINEQNKKAREQELLSRANGSPGAGGSAAARRKNYMVADEEEAFSETAMHQRILKVCFLNTIQRRHIKQHMKNIEVFEQAFATIKSTTGISDIEEIVKIFVSLEQRNFSLLTYVNQQNRDIESMEIQNKELQSIIDSCKPEGSAPEKPKEGSEEEKQSRALQETLQQIKRTEHATNGKDKDVEELSRILEECRPHIWDVVKFLKEEIPGLVDAGYEGDVPVMKVSPPDERDSQMNHHLTYVEEALMIFRACLAKDARTGLSAQPKKQDGGSLKKPMDIPSAAHFSLVPNAQGNFDDDDDEDEESFDKRPYSLNELRDKASTSISKRRNKRGQPGAGNKMLVGEHRSDYSETAAADGSAMRRSGSGRAPDPHASLFRVVTGLVSYGILHDFEHPTVPLLPRISLSLSCRGWKRALSECPESCMTP